MGRLLRVHPCPVCNYHLEEELHEGGSGIDPLFLRHHYAVAVCADCSKLVSILVPNTEQETLDALQRTQSEIVQMELDAAVGDDRARDLLPLFRAALDSYYIQPPEVSESSNHCTECGGTQLEFVALDSALFDAQAAWVHCPRCEEGQLLIETAGAWD